MTGRRPVAAFLAALEAEIESTVERHSRVILAFSGGLGSMLVGMVARKRCDLLCVVAGAEGAPDVLAARRAKAHFDYRIEVIALDRQEARRLDAELRQDHPAWSAKERRRLLPIRAVLGRTRDRPILAGFASLPSNPAFVAAIQRDQVQVPIHALRGRSAPRGTLQEAAMALGLPETWARVRHRTPIAGAGIAEFLATRDSPRR